MVPESGLSFTHTTASIERKIACHHALMAAGSQVGHGCLGFQAAKWVARRCRGLTAAMEGLRGNAPLVHLHLTVHNDAPAEPTTPTTRRSSDDSSGASSYATVGVMCVCSAHEAATTCTWRM